MCFDPEHGPLRQHHTSPVYIFEEPTDDIPHDSAHIRIGKAEVRISWLDLWDGPALHITAIQNGDPRNILGHFQIYLNTL